MKRRLPRHAGSGSGTPRKMTPERLRLIVERLAAGATMGQAARAAGVSPDTLSEWLSIAEHTVSRRHARFARDVAAAREKARQGDIATYAAFAGATLAAREDAERRERELAHQAARLVQRGASLRGAAQLLGLDYEELRVLVRRGRRTGEFPALVEAADARAVRVGRRRLPAGRFVATPANAARCAG